MDDDRKSPQPWERPSPPEFGDLSVRRLYEAIGLAISMWEMTELQLAAFYTSLTSEQEGEAFILKFEVDGGAGFRTRIDQITKAFEKYALLHPSQEDEGTFEGIRLRATQLSMRRNEIVHGHVVDGGHQYEGAPAGFLLMPSFQLRRKWLNKRPAYEFNSRQIWVIAEAFVDLRWDVQRLSDQMFGKDKPWNLARMPDMPPKPGMLLNYRAVYGFKKFHSEDDDK